MKASINRRGFLGRLLGAATIPLVGEKLIFDYGANIHRVKAIEPVVLNFGNSGDVLVTKDGVPQWAPMPAYWMHDGYLYMDNGKGLKNRVPLPVGW